jgi:hypothetical protein
MSPDERYLLGHQLWLNGVPADLAPAIFDAVDQWSAGDQLDTKTHAEQVKQLLDSILSGVDDAQYFEDAERAYRRCLRVVEEEIRDLEKLLFPNARKKEGGKK